MKLAEVRMMRRYMYYEGRFEGYGVALCSSGVREEFPQAGKVIWVSLHTSKEKDSNRVKLTRVESEWITDSGKALVLEVDEFLDNIANSRKVLYAQVWYETK